MTRFGFFRDFVIVAVIGSGMVLAHCYNRALPQPAPATLVSHDESTPFDNRHVEHIVLHTDSLGDIGFTASMPDPMPAGQKMPVVIVLGGLDTGANNIRNITNAGNNIIIGYDWPMSLTAPNDPSFLLHVPEFYERAMTVPAQIATAIDWLSTQDWADESRISILGYSMGALAAPAAQEETQVSGHIVRWTILAYGGAPLGSILASDGHIKPAWMRYALAPLVSVVFHPLEPTTSLPHLTGHFLILEGKDDALMPETARATLRDAVPEPKTVVTFEGDHMGIGPGKAELLQKIIAASREWLLRMNAVNPL